MSDLDATARLADKPAADAPWLPFIGAAVGGLLLGLAARGPGAPAWLFAALLLSAAVVALAQQTLP